MVKNTYSYIELEFLTFRFLFSAMYPSTTHLQKKSGAIFAKSIYSLASSLTTLSQVYTLNLQASAEVHNWKWDRMKRQSCL